MKRKIYLLLIVLLSSFMLFASSFDKESAKEKALKDAGLKKSDVQWLRATTERDDGWKYYEVSFSHDEYEYEFEFSEEGDLLSKSYELKRKPKQEKNATIMDSEKATSIIKKFTGGTNIKLHREKDDGITVYDAEVFTDKAFFELEIDAVTGKLISLSVEY